LVFGTGRIALNGTHGKQTFDLLQFDHFYFCVSPTERVAFIDDFRKSEAEFKGTKPIHLGDSIYTAKDLIALRVMGDYYLHDNRKPWAYLGLIQSPSAASRGARPSPGLPTIRFLPGRTTLSQPAKALLRQVGASLRPCDSCMLRLVVSEQLSCFPIDDKQSVIGWDWVSHTASFLHNNLRVPLERISFTFTENDSPNKIVLRCSTRSDEDRGRAAG
jgi:hypothetical protein